MRIVCDNCGAKYQISDEKVRNKVFKIRCKRCAHVIVVRAGQQEQGEAAAVAAAEEPTRVADQAAVAAPAVDEPTDAIWYVVVNREQVGPLTREEVEARFASGDVDAETFGWAEGMGDWIRLGSIPEFAGLAAPAPAAPAVQAAPAMQAAAPVSVFSAPEPDEDVIASNNQADVGLFGREDDGFDEGPRVSSSRHLRGQRNENSVLFSLDSLAAEAEPRASGGGGMVSNTGGTEGSGLIDISALGSGAPMGGQASLDDAFGGGGGGFAPVPAAPAAAMPTYVTRSSGNGLKVALLVVGILLLLGAAVGGTMYFLNKDGGTPVAAAPTSAAAVGTEAVAIGAPPSAAPVTVASAAPATAAPATDAAPVVSAAAAAPATEAERPRRARGPATPPGPCWASRRPPATTRTSRRPPRRAHGRAGPVLRAARLASRAARAAKGGDEVDDLLGSLDGNRSAKAPARNDAPVAANNGGGGSDPMLPEKLSRQQILLVVKQNAGGIRSCKSQDPSASGTVMVSMVIDRSGSVSSANVPSGPFKGTPVGGCVEQKVKGFRFPQFRGEPMRINMPFGL
ncbi:MAG: zinc-ribbon domain-containing protein [Myxococcales bacterium]|nr:zinc-ribbon domain-containing protein [Myxococcales bacterium]